MSVRQSMLDAHLRRPVIGSLDCVGLANWQLQQRPQPNSNHDDEIARLPIVPCGNRDVNGTKTVPLAAVAMAFAASQMDYCAYLAVATMNDVSSLLHVHFVRPIVIVVRLTTMPIVAAVVIAIAVAVD